MLTPSKLGTREYWDELYQRELTNMRESGDTGEVWFGLDSVDKMCDWVEDFDGLSADAPIASLGCGNGNLLLELYDRGFRGLHGLDYSQPSVDLASAVAAEQGKSITYKCWDILNPCHLDDSLYALCLDKGTFDAISLAEPCPDGTLPKDAYPKAAAALLENGGILLITSCNWTEAELLDQFSAYFEFHSRVKYPTFQFGGKVGQTITTIALQKIS